MGRLFWKFFFVFWLAQVATAAVVGTVIWFQHARHEQYEHGPPPLERGRPPFEHGPPPRPRGLPPPVLAIIAGGVVSLPFAALSAWYFAKPIRSLRAAFDATAGGEFDTRIGAALASRNDELADLGSDFDRMAERLQKLLETQRRLLHDVSHELRSPLARLQAAADLMRQQPERAAEFVERIERDTGRMDRLVGELLTLARLDAGMAGALDEEVDLREVVADLVEDARFEAETKSCAIEVGENGPALVRGNRELLHRALENVVRNAVRHAPAGSVVDVAVRAGAATLQVAVGDRGPGVFESDLAAIFDPFFRSGPAQGAAGYGLGLAIARRVAAVHGGRVAAANRPDGGLLVTFELPSA